MVKAARRCTKAIGDDAESLALAYLQRQGLVLVPRQYRVAVGHKGGDSARGIELTGIARAAQVVEQLLIDIPQLGTIFEVIKVDGFFQLFDHRQQLCARLHVVVGIFKHLFDDLML